MSAEEQEMLAKISQLAGQINRRKNQQAGFAPSAPQHHPTQHRTVSAPNRLMNFNINNRQEASRHRGGGHFQPRGYRVGKPAPHRHRTLVLNGATQPKSDVESGAASDASTSSWVTKSDRHLQLINSNVYEKESQARLKAIEHTRAQKRQQTDDRERAKILSHFKTTATASAPRVPSDAVTKPYEVVVDGIRFYVVKNGSKLVRVPGLSPPHVPFMNKSHHDQGDNNALSATPKMATVGGVKFYRSKNGNLYRHGIVKAQRQSGVVKKVEEPCKLFSTTGSSLIPTPIFESTVRRFSFRSTASRILLTAALVSTGSCLKGPKCRYVHDPAKVAVCKDFLAKGECPNGDACDLSHDLTPERTPACLHFAKGHCTNSNCRYTHATNVSSAAPVCRPFGIYGYCDKGAACTERHVFECPDFSNTGVCKTKGCKLLHRERASVLRKNARESGDQEMADVSSDDDGESVDSNDVDSDEVEEFIGEDDGPDLDFATQKDFIEL
ncbi:uncharacterized protein E0L32_004308 [Thyridium curvatum]|uniref:C3H1-type domain-containing protein n=1 Tax=Thyridium curvatum TaxID=1093900 RepID=A0A507BGD6_9PEZI|nr:uncharacterized protein E0L32_004308 [Thyridium curvatum]TPX15610.1 hypothetical protein E0L32_004308 [Thyridium curvatum]